MPCFAAGTLIETQNGLTRVEDLTVSDQVLTYDHGYQPLRWVGSVELSPADLRANPKLRPILIRADALGMGYPKQDLIVSPQHRVLVSSAIAQRMFNTKEVLIPAKALLALAGIERLEPCATGVTYFHLLFDDHQIVWSNGTPTESLYTGPHALNAVSPESRVEIETLFPTLCEPGFKPTSARFIPKKGKQMHKLVQRHRDNDKPIYS